jgi:hypothetical protein
MASWCCGLDQGDDEPEEEKRQFTGGAERPMDGTRDEPFAVFVFGIPEYALC